MSRANVLPGMGRDLDKFEKERVDFHVRVRLAYLERAASAPSRIAVINAGQAIESIKNEVEDCVITRCL